ncbi:hypothetical protein [Actinomadura sp. 3N407]|uniref:hypothetical protein n=1 Tax=Actinomadura sp. 3N407 TaxID=3457423 RepID=UPI003FCC707E
MEAAEEPGTKSSQAEGEAGSPGPQVPGLHEPRLRAVISLLTRQLVKNLVALVVPVGLISAAVALCGTIGLLLVADWGDPVVDDRLVRFESSAGSAVTALVISMGVMAAHLGLTALVVIKVAGSLLGRPISAGWALRTVARRSGSLLVLFGAFLATGMAVPAIVVVAGTESIWVGVIVAGCVAVPLLWWLPVTVPVVMLEGTGPLRVFPRAWEITRDRRLRMFVHLTVAVVAIPVALGAGLAWPVSLFTGIEHHAAQIVAATVTGVLTTIVQGTALAVVALEQRRPPTGRPDLGSGGLPAIDLAAVADRLSAHRPTPKTRPAVALPLTALTIAALAAPGFIYGAYLHGIPNSSLAVDEQPVLHDVGHSVLLDDGTLITARSDKHHLCSDRECSEISELPNLPGEAFPSVRAAKLPDGSFAVVQWQAQDGRKPVSEDLNVKLTRCTAEECANSDQDPRLATIPNFFEGDADIAVSTRGILVAVLTDTKDRGRAVDRLRLLRCASVPCKKSELLAELRLPEPNSSGLEPIGLALGAGERPVVAYEDGATGAITLLSCADPDCRRSVTRHPVGPAFFSSSEEAKYFRGAAKYNSGVELVVPPDDRPVLVHRDTRTGTARLLRCRTPACPEVDVLPLTEPDLKMRLANLALGPGGLPIVATIDRPHKRAVLIVCDVADCSRRDTVDLGGYSTDHAGSLDMSVARDGRPRVLWDYRMGAESPYTTFLLTCRESRCGS